MKILPPLLLLGLLAVSAGAIEPDNHSLPAIQEAMRLLVEADWIDADRAFLLPKPEPVRPPTKNPQPVTTRQDAAGGCDGVKDGHLGFHTASNEQDPWWQVDLGRPTKLDCVVVHNRTDGNTAPRTRNIRVLVTTDERAQRLTEVYRHNGETFGGILDGKPLVVDFGSDPDANPGSDPDANPGSDPDANPGSDPDANPGSDPDGVAEVTARIVRLQVPGRCSFALDEVEIFGTDDPRKNIALGKPADQKSTSPYSYPGTRGHKQPTASQLPASSQLSENSRLPPAQFRLAHARAVVDRGEKLLARLRGTADPGRLDPLAAELAGFDLQLRKLEAADNVPESVRREHYLLARTIVRKIAFANPLLDIDKILFVKRHDPGGLYHMVHQYYGFGAKPGGGLFVLEGPFSSEPKLVDLLEHSVVERGRLAGRKLVPGAFVSPEVAFDGRSILFAYSQAEAEGVEWSPRASYHIFRVNADGTGLVQLTDGPWNEFDPCFLPNGRIVFVSERRGGYLRCGGSSPPYHSPTYTLHSMNADGGDLVCLSFHETQEWHPSVDNNGMLIYTRWDYVDRDTNVAHHIWNCFPDGRDPRSFHGNYPDRRESRPWMEMSTRAVPGSNRYVATAAAHHGIAFGSLLLIDYRPEDDGAMSQIERITPDVPFPESEGGKPMIRQRMAYGTAWPLGEDDYLCVYDRHATNRGIYWIDRFGNRELLYRDPAISCLSPIPLAARPCPPIIPERTTQTAQALASVVNSNANANANASVNSNEKDQAATITLMDVYDSDFPWPEETKITSLRIVQVLPKTVPRVNEPRIGVAEETNARAVLGTVPVEADGSAYFEAPVGKLLYFQALDERGLAVQSMRSGTYVHPGERLVCQGCHERKHRPPSMSRAVASALRREPSKIRPEPEGSYPFSYARLVQPVLDRHCVACHRQQKALDLGDTVEGPHGWTRSYTNLAETYGFYFHVSNGSINSGVHGGSRTIPGKFGARASKLLKYLDHRHYGVKLSREDFHRITLWLDSNSEFYGAYHDIEAQARGKVVFPRLD